MLFVFQLYSDSEQAFLRVLQLDHNCPDAIEGLVEVRTYQLMVSKTFNDWLKFVPIINGL